MFFICNLQSSFFMSYKFFVEHILLFFLGALFFRLKMVVFKRYGYPNKCPQKLRGEKENCRFLINSSSK